MTDDAMRVPVELNVRRAAGNKNYILKMLCIVFRYAIDN
jgi:hypothetical protein